jgi:predicted small metal-binding protein
MKRLSCRDLGGPCDAEFVGESFEEVGKKSRAHVMEQMQKGDQAHVTAAGKMRTATPEQQQAMMAEFKKKFDQAPNV